MTLTLRPVPDPAPFDAAAYLDGAVELNGDYYRDGVGHLRRMEATVSAPTLFDQIAMEAAD